jgi:hypothetical protein
LYDVIIMDRMRVPGITPQNSPERVTPRSSPHEPNPEQSRIAIIGQVPGRKRQNSDDP